MTPWKRIDDVASFEELRSAVDWHDSFIREVHLVAPSYIDDSDGILGTVAAECPASARATVICPGGPVSGVEFLFVDVDDYSWHNMDIEPRVHFEIDRVVWSFFGDEIRGIRARQVLYRFLGRDCWGYPVRLGKRPIFDKRGELRLEDLEDWEYEV